MTLLITVNCRLVRFEKIKETDDLEEAPQVTRFTVRISDPIKKLEDLIAPAGVMVSSVYSGGEKLNEEMTF